MSAEALHADSGGDDILSVRGLTVAFAGSEGTEHVAVNDFCLTIGAGEFVGVMGEPGCGKSTAAIGMMGLVRPPGRIVSGEVHYLGRDLLAMNDAELDAIRGKDIGPDRAEPAHLAPSHADGRPANRERLPRAQPREPQGNAHARAIEMLQLVGINDPERRVKSYPHELSTGMTQRVLIAMAMSSGPRLLIADEPTSGLDVTIQAQFLDQMWETANRTGSAVLLVTQNLGIVANYCDPRGHHGARRNRGSQRRRRLLYGARARLQPAHPLPAAGECGRPRARARSGG